MIAVAMLGHRWRSVLGGFITLVLGVCLMTASGTVIVSSLPTVLPRLENATVVVVPHQAGTRYDGSTIRASWSESDVEAMVDRLSSDSRIRSAVAERRFEIRVMDGNQIVDDSADGPVTATGWSSFLLGDGSITAGAPLTEPNQIVVPDSYGLDPGDIITILTATASWTLMVAATTDSDGVFVDDVLAAEATAQVGLIGVTPTPGADPKEVMTVVQTVIGDHGVVLAADDRAAVRPDGGETRNWGGVQLLILIMLITAFVSVFVVGTTFTFQVAVRRRELALIRAVGGTPGQVRGMLLREAVTVGVAAAVVGAFAGVLGSGVLGGWLVETGLLAHDWRTTLSPAPVAAAMLVGIGTSVVGVWSASGDAAAVSPMEALRPRARTTRTMSARRWVVTAGAGMLATGLAVGTVHAEQGLSIGLAMGVSAALVVTAAAAAPAYLPRLFALAPGRRSPLVELLRAEARTGAGRLAATMLPALLIAALAVTLLGMNATVGGALAEHSSGDLPGETALRRAGGGTGVTDASVERAARLAAAPVVSTLSTGVYVNGRWVEAVGLRADAPPADTVRASPAFAAELGWEHGDSVDLTWRDGTTGRVIVNIAPLPAHAELWADIALSHELARKHDRSTFISSAYVDGVDPAELSLLLADQGVSAEPVTGLIEAGIADELAMLTLFTWVLLGLALGYAAVSTANTLSLATAARRRDLALLRVIGAHRRQVVALALVETASTVGVGLLVGAGLSLPGLFALAHGMRDDFDPRQGLVAVDVVVPWLTVGLVFVACAAVSLVAATVPAVRALSRQGPR